MTTPEIPPLAPGFADPVHDAQRTFRILLAATSRPGSIHSLPCLPQPPVPLAPALAATLLTLADLDTPVWLAPTVDTAQVRQWLAFHCGCPLTQAPSQATFAVSGRDDGLQGLEQLALGSPEYPDRGATLLAEVAELRSVGPWRLSGPGIEGEHQLGVGQAPEALPALFARNRCLFPQGVDLLLVAGPRLAAIPRSTLVEVAPCM